MVWCGEVVCGVWCVVCVVGGVVGVVVWWCGRGEKRWCSSGALEYHPTAPPPHRKDTPEPHIVPEGNNDNNSPDVKP